MNIKKLLSSLLACAMVAGAAGCSSGQAPTAEQTTENSSAEATDPAATGQENLSEEEQRKAMIDRSLMTVGDTSRMVTVLQKAARGEEITVGYIGGSITEGLTVGAETCWARRSYDWLCTQFPDTKINYVNAGMSGTPSGIGLIRAERDLYTFDTLTTGGRTAAVIAEELPAQIQPDIVFVEFAVNDGQEPISKECYESLVRKILEKDNQPAVVLLFTILENGYTCQPHMSMVGEQYNLPMISVGDALTPEFESGRMKWETYSDDQSHPNEYGHILVADMVKNYFEQVMPLAEGDAPQISALPDGAIFSDSYKDMILLDGANLTADSLGGFEPKEGFLNQFRNGWINKNGGSEPIVFTISCKSLFMVLHTNNSGRFGAVDVKVDGEKVITVNSNRSGGWGAPDYQLIFSDEQSAEHKIEISMAEGYESSYFGLLGFGVVR